VVRLRRHARILGLAAVVAGTAAACLGGGHAAAPVVAARVCTAVPRSGTTVVPNVRRMAFDVALHRLLGRRLLVSVPRFIFFHAAMAEQGWGRLQNYLIVSQSPRAGSRVRAGVTVRLRLDNPLFRGPIGSMGIPSHHPRYAHIPNLVGDDYRRAMAAGTERSGILVRVSTTGALTPRASTCGLNAFIVASQTPRPGKRVLWGGVRGASGVQPSLATVTIALVSRPPA
jgi:hypothetical protein